MSKKRVVVIGGGVIRVELAFVYAALGAKDTIVDGPAGNPRRCRR